MLSNFLTICTKKCSVPVISNTLFKVATVRKNKMISFELISHFYSVDTSYIHSANDNLILILI